MPLLSMEEICNLCPMNDLFQTELINQNDLDLHKNYEDSQRMGQNKTDSFFFTASATTDNQTSFPVNAKDEINENYETCNSPERGNSNDV